jgi:glycosyltransferase involved in cell wall biosynthesis
MSYIPQHASEEMLNLDLTAEDNGVSDFVYAGNMGAGQNLSVIIEAVAKLKDRKDFIVHMVGDGSYREKLEQQARELGVSDKFVFYGNKKRDEMSEYYKKADALLITLRGNNAVGDTMPGKLQTYMTTGKPILGAINGAAKETIEISEQNTPTLN